MSKLAENYYNNLLELMNSINITNKKGEKLEFYNGIEIVCDFIIAQAKLEHKIIFIGNGASAAISSHMASDFWKNGDIRATAFNDSSLLTCISNDYGYEHVFEKPIEMFGDKGEILFAISSSGQSENILNGVKAARSKECTTITLSGFKENNPLKSMGEFNFYVPSQSYGHVEIIHQSICHCILDIIIHKKTE